MLQSQSSYLPRQRLAEHIIEAKATAGLSWRQISAGTGLSVEFVTAALLGQHPLPQEAAALICQRLGLDADAAALLQAIPMRGSSSHDMPTDPIISQLHEMLQVYGSTLKALIHEQFGDGIVSAINFKLDIKQVSDPDGGVRAIITLDGKYLPLKPF